MRPVSLLLLFLLFHLLHDHLSQLLFFHVISLFFISQNKIILEIKWWKEGEERKPLKGD